LYFSTIGEDQGTGTGPAGFAGGAGFAGATGAAGFAVAGAAGAPGLAAGADTGGFSLAFVAETDAAGEVALSAAGFLSSGGGGGFGVLTSSAMLRVFQSHRTVDKHSTARRHTHETLFLTAGYGIVCDDYHISNPQLLADATIPTSP